MKYYHDNGIQDTRQKDEEQQKIQIIQKVNSRGARKT